MSPLPPLLLFYAVGLFFHYYRRESAFGHLYIEGHAAHGCRGACKAEFEVAAEIERALEIGYRETGSRSIAELGDKLVDAEHGLAALERERYILEYHIHCRHLSHKLSLVERHCHTACLDIERQLVGRVLGLETQPLIRRAYRRAVAILIDIRRHDTIFIVERHAQTERRQVISLDIALIYPHPDLADHRHRRHAGNPGCDVLAGNFEPSLGIDGHLQTLDNKLRERSAVGKLEACDGNVGRRLGVIDAHLIADIAVVGCRAALYVVDMHKSIIEGLHCDSFIFTFCAAGSKSQTAQKKSSKIMQELFHLYCQQYQPYN